MPARLAADLDLNQGKRARIKMTIQCKGCVIVALLLVFATACSSITTKPIKPSIELISVSPLNISLSEQKLRFKLKVSNPNSFSLPIQSIDFIARFNQTDIASGKSKHTTLVPANGDAMLTLDVTAGIDRLMTTLQTLLQGQTLNMNYELAGSVKIENWSTPIPFDVSAEMDIDNAIEG